MQLLSKLKLYLPKFLCLVLISYLVMMTHIAQAQQTLRIGTTFFYPPYIMATKNQVFGFEADYMQTVCKLMDKQCFFSFMRFDKLFDALQQGTIDVAIASITITAERQQQFLFSYPYMLSNGAIVVNSDSLLKNQKDLFNKTVGLQTSSVFAPILRKQYNNAISIKYYDVAADLIEALTNKQVDAIVLDNHNAHFWRAQLGGKLRILGPEFKLGTGLGIMANKNNVGLITDINQAIVLLQNDGSFTRLYNQYFAD